MTIQADTSSNLHVVRAMPDFPSSAHYVVGQGLFASLALGASIWTWCRNDEISANERSWVIALIILLFGLIYLVGVILIVRKSRQYKGIQKSFLTATKEIPPCRIRRHFETGFAWIHSRDERVSVLEELREVASESLMDRPVVVLVGDVHVPPKLDPIESPIVIPNKSFIGTQLLRPILSLALFMCVLLVTVMIWKAYTWETPFNWYQFAMCGISGLALLGIRSQIGDSFGAVGCPCITLTSGMIELFNSVPGQMAGASRCYPIKRGTILVFIKDHTNWGNPMHVWMICGNQIDELNVSSLRKPNEVLNSLFRAVFVHRIQPQS